MTFSFVRRAGDVDVELEGDFRVQADRHFVHSDRLDRLVERDVATLDLVAGV